MSTGLVALFTMLMCGLWAPAWAAPPVLDIADTNTIGSEVILSFDQVLDAAAPPVATDFSVDVDGVPASVAGVA